LPTSSATTESTICVDSRRRLSAPTIEAHAGDDDVVGGLLLCGGLRRGVCGRSYRYGIRLRARRSGGEQRRCGNGRKKQQLGCHDNPPLRRGTFREMDGLPPSITLT
jgi:hypothetical protein